MATIQELVTAIGLLDSSVQLQTSEAATSKTSLDTAVLQFQDIINKVNTELNEVDNTSDADKPISAAQTIEIDKKVNITDLATINGNAINTGEALVIARSATSLVYLEYENRKDLETISVLPIVDDSVQVEGIGLFKYYSTRLEPIDDETCFNHQDGGQWILMNPHFDLSQAYDLVERAILFEFMEDTNDHLENHIYHPHED